MTTPSTISPSGASVAELLASGRWTPIPKCPGRFRLREPAPQSDPSEVLGYAASVRFAASRHARDRVALVRLIDGGLISYLRADGTYCHTLAQASGWTRKLAQLGIPDS